MANENFVNSKDEIEILTREQLEKLYEEVTKEGIELMDDFIRSIYRRIAEMSRYLVHEKLQINQKSNQTLDEREFGTGDPEFDEFRRMCISHDWYYSYSDDIEVWQRGSEVQKKLEDIVATKGGKYRVYWENHALKKLRHI